MNAKDHAAHLRLELSSRAENVPVVRQALSGLADVISLPPADLRDIGTAVTEACNNVSVHAYRGREGPLEVDLIARDTTTIVTVRDRGMGLSLDGATRVDFPSDVDGELSGIGVPSIKALTRSARWTEPAGGGTEVEMRFSTGSLAWEDVGSGYAFAEHLYTAPGRPANAIEVGIAPLSIARGVLPRLLRVAAARADFSIDRHADIQRVGSVVLLADPSIWAASGVHARLAARGDSLEVAIGPLSDEDVARLVVAVRATEPRVRASAERLLGRPLRLVLQLPRSPNRASGARPTPNEASTSRDDR
jgi:anti-sigma regulatory factor (Ser/Thr protein kinase)